MNSSTKVTISNLGLYLEEFEDSDDLIIVFPEEITEPSALLVRLSDVVMGTEYEGLNFTNVKYQIDFLTHLYEKTIKLFPIQTRTSNIIMSLPDESGIKGLIRDTRSKPEKKFTLDDFNLYTR